MKTDLEPIPSLQPKFVSAKVGDLEPNGAHHNLQDSGPKWIQMAQMREAGEMVRWYTEIWWSKVRTLPCKIQTFTMLCPLDEALAISQFTRDWQVNLLIESSIAEEQWLRTKWI